MAKKKGRDIVDRLADAFSSEEEVSTPVETAPLIEKPVIVTPEKPVIVEAPAIIKPKTFEERIIDGMKKYDFPIDVGSKLTNIIYVEGTNPDGTKNNNHIDGFYDVRSVVRVHDSGNIELLGVWEATTEPGWYFRRNRINTNGAAAIKPGYQRCWQTGMHRGKQWALVQTGGDCEVYRDDNEDGFRRGDKLYKGPFGINQHAGYDFPRDKIKTASAGCLVGRTMKGHQYFMDIVTQDARYLANKRYVFGTTVLERGQVE